eukprot:1675220-Alexandrium_andersonii.AAC.1
MKHCCPRAASHAPRRLGFCHPQRSPSEFLVIETPFQGSFEHPKLRQPSTAPTSSLCCFWKFS